MFWQRTEAVMLALGSGSKYKWSFAHLLLHAQGLGIPALVHIAGGEESKDILTCSAWNAETHKYNCLELKIITRKDQNSNLQKHKLYAYFSISWQTSIYLYFYLQWMPELLTQEAGVKAHGIHGDLVPFPQVEHFQQVLSR